MKKNEHYDPDVFGSFEPERPPAEAIWDYCTKMATAEKKYLIHNHSIYPGDLMRIQAAINAYENVIDYIKTGYAQAKEREG